jgi:subtilisin family serine protease
MTRGVGTTEVRRPLLRALGALAVALALLPAGGAKAQGQSPSGSAGRSTPSPAGDSVPGEVIVRWRRGTSADSRAAARRESGAGLKRGLGLSNAELVRVPRGREDAVARSLERQSNVEFAEPNGIVRGMASPDEPRFGELWGLHNTGQTVAGVAGTADADIDAPEAWELGRGLAAPPRVAVVDSGVAFGHPDIQTWVNPGESGEGRESNGIDDDGNGKVDDWRGWDFVENDNLPQDEHGHGTHVAGTLGARAGNGAGVAGVSAFPALSAGSPWQAQPVMALRVLGANNTGTWAGVVDGFTYAGRMGAKVVNASLGGSGTSQAVDAAIADQPDTLFVVAAGNGNTNLDSYPFTPCVPASLPDTPNKLCVGATTPTDARAGFSNHSTTHVDLGAPGTGILSASPFRSPLSDDFEADLAGRWTSGGTGVRWGRSTQWKVSGNHSVADSPVTSENYDDNTNSWIRSGAIDLSKGSGCRFTARARIVTLTGDHLRIEATRTPSTESSWQTIFSYSGSGGGSIDQPMPFSGHSGVYLRLRLTSNSSGVADGAFLDDLAVRCRTADYDSSSYAFMQGTSMASPHVAGAAAFVWTKHPSLTVAQTRERVLRADKLPELSASFTDGRRLNLHQAAKPQDASSPDDIPPPETTITSSPPAQTTSTTATFAFVASESGSRFECSIDGSAFTSCTSPRTYTGLGVGEHTFRVRALDQAGNVDQSPATHPWRIVAEEQPPPADTTPPETTIDSGPDPVTTGTSAAFTFSADEAGSTFECSLDGAAFTACTSPREYTGLSEGEHSLRVRAIDPAGNLDPTPAQHVWRVEAERPRQTCKEADVTFGAAADAWVDQNSPLTNKGSDSVLKVQSKAPGNNMRALVRFELPDDAPEGCVLESATLRLHAGSAKSGRTLRAWRLSSPWSESLVTWMDQPGTVGEPASSNSGQGYREWDVTALVEQMYAVANHGFVIRDGTEEGPGVEQQLHSREKGDDKPPELMLRFRGAGGG